MKQLLTLLFSLATAFTAAAQTGNDLSGIVVDSAQEAPLPGVTIYLNGTSKGAISGDDGRFTIHNIRPGRYDIVVSSIGQETLVYPISGDNLPRNIKFILRPQPTELQAAIVQPWLKDGWERYGQFFLDNFIGTTPNAAQCSIRNRKALRFYFYHNRLSVSAAEPLIIENDALGYSIQYKLEQFISDYDHNMVVYFGYPLFHEMETTKSGRRRTWETNRRQAYYGSIMHFMRLLYARDSSFQGFVLQRYSAATNQEKCRVEEVYHPDSPVTKKTPPDSIAYWQRVLRQPDVVNVALPVSPASLYAADTTRQTSLLFSGRLSVVYIDRNAVPGNPATPARRVSGLRLITPAPVTIDVNGSYFPPQELLTDGAWGRSEKIANLLPVDYDPTTSN
jgi:hypothetical protein